VSDRARFLINEVSEIPNLQCIIHDETYDLGMFFLASSASQSWLVCVVFCGAELLMEEKSCE